MDIDSLEQTSQANNHPLREPPTGKVYFAGTHRLEDPADTFRRISEKFALMGLTRVSDVTGLDCIGIPVCMAIRPNSKSLSVSQGKGITLMAAKVSAAMESIEAHHAQYIEAELTTARYSELKARADALDPETLNLHPRSVYHPDLPIQWMKGTDLQNESEVYVPFDLVQLDFLDRPLSPPVFDQSSNGLASGNHILEAVSHAICEVAERHSTLLWSVTANLPEAEASYLDLDTIDSPLINGLLDKLHRANVDVMISNQASPIGIPTFGCDLFVHDADRAALLPTFSGFGCHLSKEVAILRAVTEAVQSRLTLIAGSRDDLSWNDYRENLDGISRGNWLKRLQRIKTVVDYRSLPSLETDSLAGDVEKELALLRAAGFQRAALVDLTNPEIGIPVARVVIPGAEFRSSRRAGRIKKHILRKLTEMMEAQQ